MSRNAESRFAMNPTNIDISRSRFMRNSSVKTSFNVGDVIPFYVDEVLPGDTFSIDTSKVCRMQTPLTPIMDNIYLDTYWYFVPNRLVWDHWKEFMGENTESAWIPATEYNVPQIVSPATTGFDVGTIADYLGVPTGVPDLSMSALPFRAYALIMNEWFRDENLTDPLVIPKNETTVTGVNTGNYITDTAKGGLPFKAAKFHDYFTSALPAPQKGPDVMIPVGDVQAGYYPVVTGPDLGADAFNENYGNKPLYFATTNSTHVSSTATGAGWPLVLGSSAGTYPGQVGFGTYQNQNFGMNSPGLHPANLWASVDFNAQALSASINQLRLAFQIQKWYEKAARGGTRYIETLKAHFGVTSPDARLQRPEYLGGNRIPININQVVQNSETGTTPQGTTAAFSLTTDRHSDFTHSFTEHGLVIGLMVARYDHSYQQGLERFWSRKSIFDYYWPVFANIGEQGIRNKEIYAQADTVTDANGDVVNEQIFGYQEAWADYRYKPSHVTGEMRSTYAQSLDVWHLADDYASLPALSDAWIREDKSTVDRVLAVSSANANQLFADIYVKNMTTRPMPMYSVPGLIDHH